MKKHKRLIPGFGISLGITITMLSLLILIPLLAVILHAASLGPSDIIRLLMRPNVLHAFGTSILTAFIAAIINVIFGLILAWVLVRYDFPGKSIMNSMIELPFALPTAVAGITLSKLYSESGLIGAELAKWGIQAAYTKVGIIIALIFVGIPFVVRAVEPVLANIDHSYEEAGYVMGASKWQIYKAVIIPELISPLLAGFGLAFARGIGEYGSVIYISGNSIREHTQVVSYVIMQKLNYADYASATAMALALLIISFAVLLTVNMIQVRRARRVQGR